MSSTVRANIRLQEEERLRLEEERRKREKEERRQREEADRRRLEEEKRRREEEERQRKLTVQLQATEMARVAREIRKHFASIEPTQALREAPIEQCHTSAQHTSHSDRVERIHTKMREIISTLEVMLSNIPDDLRTLHSKRLLNIEKELHAITAQKEHNFSMHEARLKQLRDDLYDILDQPEAHVASWYKSLDGLAAIKEDLSWAQATLLPGPLSSSVTELAGEIDGFIALGDLDVLKKQQPSIDEKYRRLLDNIEQYKTQLDEKERIFELLAQALEKMGYRATAVKSETITGGQTVGSYFATPSGAAVNVRLGQNGKLETEFIHLKNEVAELSNREMDTAINQCRNWCGDLVKLRERLTTIGVELEIDQYSAVSPDRGGFMVMARNQFTDKQKKAENDDELWEQQDQERTID